MIVIIGWAQRSDEPSWMINVLFAENVRNPLRWRNYDYDYEDDERGLPIQK